jgi:hypothetical protein
MSRTEQKREAFEAWLRTKPEARLWNTTDAMFAAYCAAITAPAAEPQAAPIPCAVHFAGRTFGAGTPFCDVIEHVESTRLRGGVPEGWSITRKGDGRIVVKAPSGDAWAWADEHSTGTSMDFVYALLNAWLTAAPQAPALDAGVVRDAWAEAANWLRNNYQYHPNIASLCDAMREFGAKGPQ